MRNLIAEFIDQVLPRTHTRPEIQHLFDLMRDYPVRGGKMLRSQLLMMVARAFGGPAERALPLAAGLEMFQNWVLIHDDIEDDSEDRRGQPALHRLHGIPLALNAGDALHVYMWQVVHQSGVPGAFEEFLNTIHRTAEGQHVDLSWVVNGSWDLSEADYLQMVHLKTAYYTVVAPFRLGMLAAGLTPDPEIEAAGLKLGAAFQIRDDVLNLIGDAADYGKEIAGDLLEGKRTLVLLHWLAQASPEQKAFFLKVMSLPRDQKQAADIQQILQWLHDSGSIQHAQHMADAEAAEGLRLIRNVLSRASDQKTADQILHLLEQLATRMV
ncbi:polyprenyl synthetase family protein [Deinococcus cellulosilyticus]|uniref:Geranylgeranyl diphosphate synthetase n=1 Tax=Deinococcus cellulosilyticus (strain DSM 18568 / NBRC 106333 / KACC 11606 / 5516J-15) TaxID=1223518 RepID=A0A511N5D2_DEIC1|nr:polyprenyl synthetase family protein [Deinococcus cellulosilyticus]GEM48065.1 geranylgeranyl diphosphate synthetase [Deinococcus cellulosilyticus NBRC 106333 = KACC 11606]